MNKFASCLCIVLAAAGTGCATTSGAAYPGSSQRTIQVAVREMAAGMQAKFPPGKRTSLAIIGFTSIAEPKPAASDPFSSYVVEELTIALVNAGQVSVAERSQLQKVMEELKLQSSGAVSDSSAKQLGQLLGVDGIVIGSYLSLDNQVQVNARIIATESGQVQWAGSALIDKDNTVVRLLREPAAGMGVVGPVGAVGPVGPVAQPLPPLATRQQAEAAELYRSGRALQRPGKGLTITGIVFVGVASIMLGSCAAAGCMAPPVLYGGGTMAGLGAVFVGIGIPLWAVGSSRMSEARRRGYVTAEIMPFVSPVRGGAVAGLTLARF